VFYALVYRDGRLVYVNAAHPPPLILRADGNRVDLDATAMPVGMMPNAEFPATQQLLGAGDKVVIYSDGVTEAQDAEGRFFGRKRLREAAAASSGSGCAAIHSAIQDAVTAFTGGAVQSDDITLLVLEFQG
jgi:sigma-B regulation protein RsbU (phosphoserine phosphatase)